MKQINLEGVIPAAILPMNKDYEPDYKAFQNYIEWLVKEGAVAVAVNMDTGEGPQLSEEERITVIKEARIASKGRISVLSGVMGATTMAAAKSAEAYAKAGAEGLVVFPNAGFRNSPLDDRIPVDYHKAIADSSGLPIVLFQLAPIFGGVLYSRETLLKLLEVPGVCAMKEASFDAQMYTYTIDTLKMSSHKITLLTGNDLMITESLLLGAKGALLGVCAIGCGLVARMLREFQCGHVEKALEMRETVQNFAKVIYADPMLDYRARAKVALSLIGVISPDLTYVRPPMLQIDESGRKAIDAGLKAAGYK